MAELKELQPHRLPPNPVRIDGPWTRAAAAWLKAHEAHEKTKLTLEKKRWALTKLAGDSSASGAGVSVTRYFRAGTINYGSIPELAGVALDAYRKPGSWEVRVTKA
jgi:hypothetical protein